MNHARATRRPSARTAKESAPRKGLKWIAALLILLLMGVTAWAYLPEGKHPSLVKIEELRGQMAGASEEQQRELWQQLREAYRELPEEQREQARDERRQRWEARERRFYDEFFAMTADEQIEKLDEQIQESEERARQREARRAERGDQGARGRRGGRGRGARGSLERRKRYLDRTPPTTRAQRSEYRRMRAARRKALGLPERRWRR